jgi:hypothetical protein
VSVRLLSLLLSIRLLWRVEVSGLTT